MTLVDLHLLDTYLCRTITAFSAFHELEDSPYWNAVHEIMDDCYRLQDRVREDIREKEKKGESGTNN